MNHSVCKPRARRGFTLVELLIVIGVIALLAAIMFPVFGRVREGGRRAACSSNLKQLGLAFTQYRQDNNGRFPGAGQYQKWGNGGHWVSGVNSDNFTGDPGSLAYVSSNGVIPGEYREGATANVEAGALYPLVKAAGVYSCPSNKTGGQKRLSYSMNCAINGMKDTRIREPSEIILLVDEGKANDGYLYTAGKIDPDGTSAEGGGTSTDELTQVHNGTGNLLFVDGHVKAYPFKVFPMTPENSQLKVETARGKIRFQDRAFGPDGYFVGAPAFGTCFEPNLQPGATPALPPL